MVAEDHLQSRQFLYHEAHLNNRESIRRSGLRPGKAWMSYDGSEEIAPAGVYMSPHGFSEYSSSMHDSSHFGYDRWRVDVTGLPVHADPTQPKSARYTPGPVPPDRLRLVKKGSPNWERNI